MRTTPKYAKVCARCHETKPSRYRMLLDAHVCAECMAAPTAVTHALQAGPAMAVRPDASLWEFDVEHLR